MRYEFWNCLHFSFYGSKKCFLRLLIWKLPIESFLDSREWCTFLALLTTLNRHARFEDFKLHICRRDSLSGNFSALEIQLLNLWIRLLTSVQLVTKTNRFNLEFHESLIRLSEFQSLKGWNSISLFRLTGSLIDSIDFWCKISDFKPQTS